MKTITLLFSFLFLSSLLYAQNMEGSWSGRLQVQGNTLQIVFNIRATDTGFTSTMDSPDQGASGLATDNTSIIDNNIIIVASKFGITYKGTYLPDSNKINGTFNQGPGSFPLTLSRSSDLKTVAKPVKRPQDPTEFPYKQEEITFKNSKAGNLLSGTLTTPSTGKFSKIVVLISGSGPQNRDEEIEQFNHRPFLVWSDWLTRNGIAVLRYDDRGVGKSTGQFATATSADFADDAEAAVTYINGRKDLKGLNIGLVGHSEGGMIAPIVASRNPLVKFIVLLAGPGVPISELMVKQNSDLMRLSGAADSAIAASSAVNREIYQAFGDYKTLSPEKFKVKIDSIFYATMKTKMPNLSAEKISQTVNESSNVINTPWFRYFITFNPADYLIKIKCPVLAINGTLDMQVNSDANLNGIKTSLIKAGNNKFEIVPLVGLNHLLQKATTGSVNEYAQISETVNPVALQKVAQWINKL